MSEWQLVYANGEGGEGEEGDIVALAQAVTAGADVKVSYTASDGTVWARRCLNAAVVNSVGAIVVVATTADVLDTVAAPNGDREFSQPFALEYHIYNSSGSVSEAKFFPGGEEATIIQVNFKSLRWFIRQ